MCLQKSSHIFLSPSIKVWLDSRRFMWEVFIFGLSIHPIQENHFQSYFASSWDQSLLRAGLQITQQQR